MNQRLLDELAELGLDADNCPSPAWRKLLDRMNRCYEGAQADGQLRASLKLELRRAKKLEALGRLIAGITHEINSPIHFVGHNIAQLRSALHDLLELCEVYRQVCAVARTQPLRDDDLQVLRLAEEVADVERMRQTIDRAVAATQEGVARVAELAAAVTSFAHPGQERRTLADINAAVKGSIVVASTELKYHASIETDLGELSPVLCHIGDISQVILNLLVNAGHAIGKRNLGSGAGAGSIRVVTSQDDQFVTIAVADNGSGIPENIRHRIFEPFFTTKEPGQGSGQGLALAWSVVVHKHGGTLTFETRPGKGTTFYVRLPRDVSERAP